MYVEPYLRQVQIICQERGYTQERERIAIDDAFTQIGDQGKLYLNRLIVMLGTKCSLRCRDCNVCIPRYAAQKDLDLSVLIAPMDRILGMVDGIAKVELVGGEPFISSNLKPMMEYMLGQEKIMAVEMTTNGMIDPDENVVSLLQDEKVYVYVSDYGVYADCSKGVDF